MVIDQYIPIDIVNYILEFLFFRCEKCKSICYYNEAVKNCRIFEYRSVFHDSYYLIDDVDVYLIICKHCIQSYSDKHIVNTDDNIYKWANEY